MTQTTSPFADSFAKLLTDAAGMAQGFKKEAETVVKTQAERMMAGLDIPSREEFEALREMAQKARDENDVLKARLMSLEEKIDALSAKPAKKA